MSRQTHGALLRPSIAVREVQSLSPDTGPKRSKVLIVDDHPLIQRGLQYILNGDGSFEVCGQACDWNQALQMTKQCQPNLVILDISLGGQNGLALIEELKQACEAVRVLILSVHDQTIYAERSIRAGAHGYVSKDAPAEQLLIAMRQVAAGKIYLSDDLTDRMFRAGARGSGGGARVNSGGMGSALDQLSDREIEIFRMIGQGHTTREIAKALSRSIKTVETHREAIKNKLGLKDASELAYHAIRWVTLNP